MIYKEQVLVSLDGMRNTRSDYIKQYTESAESVGGALSPVLRVKFRAITANKVTRNRTFYPIEELEGDGASKGYITVLQPYPIPIMLDHRTTGTSMLTSSDMPVPVGRAVDARVVRKGRGRKDGYLEIDAVIYDRRVIEMILDGRFMTVSIGQIPSRVECSVCGEEVNGFECRNGHVRGDNYEWNGEIKSCYHIMRGLEFIEVSFVNVPSDSDAVVLSKALDSGTLTSGGLEMTDIDSLKATVQDAVNESIADDAAGEVVSESVETVGSPESHADTSVDASDDDLDVSPAELYLIDGDLPFPEARLTAAQRKKLPDSAFCGPNRSFPAHDKPHVLAGLRLLGRAKLSPAQKARVRACLLRKARQLGMKTGQDDDRETAVVFWLTPEGSLDLREFELHELPAIPEAANVVMSYSGTVLLEVSDEQFAHLCGSEASSHPQQPVASSEAVVDELAELRHTVSELESQMREWMERALKAEEQLKLVERETLVMRAVSAAISAGYPAAVGKTAAELYELFSSRSEEFLKALIEDLASSGIVEVARQLTDVKNPLEGINVGEAEGLPSSASESNDSNQSDHAVHRYSAVDELLSALKSGRVSVEENEQDGAEVFRVFFR